MWGLFLVGKLNTELLLCPALLQVVDADGLATGTLEGERVVKLAAALKRGGMLPPDPGPGPVILGLCGIAI